MVALADPFTSNDEHVRYAAYCRAVDADESTEMILDMLARDPDQLMADGVRIRMIQRATSRDSVEALAERPEFRSQPVQRKARERSALIEASEAISDNQLLAVVATGLKQAQVALLDRPDLPESVLEAISRDGATTAVRNRADHQLGKKR